MSEHIELFRNVTVEYYYDTKNMIIKDEHGKNLAGIKISHWDWEGDEKDFIRPEHLKRMGLTKVVGDGEL